MSPTTQACPNCGHPHDIRVYVSGQRVQCRCGIRFEARRGDVAAEVARNTMVPTGSGLQERRPPAHGTSGAVTVVPHAEPAPGIDISLSRVSEPVGSGPHGGVNGPPGVVAQESSGVAMPSSKGSSDAPVDPTLVRSSAKTGSGSARSDLNGHEDSTFVGGGKVDLPGFELLEMLGRGGMGEVWLARQQSLGRTVAVKLLPPRLAKDPEFVTRFEKEATALAALNHPHIIQIIDRGVAGEHYYFVMEYVEGRSLREAMSAGLTPEKGIKLLLAVARAIECAHDKGIIHRDLKPENILLDGRGHVKVADFGLAGIRAPDSRLQLTATSVAMGTLNYMAPEQRRDAKNVDGRADLFSLGVILYEVLTGELPLGRFKLPSARVPGLDSRVDPVVDRLLEQDPAARYQKAGELCAALEAMTATSSAPGIPQGELDGRLVPAAARSVRPARQTALSRQLRSGWRRVRGGLSVVGGLALLGFAVRWFVGPVSLHLGEDQGVIIGTKGVRVKPGNQVLPPNTYGEVFSTLSFAAPAKAGGTSRLELGFNEGNEEINVHSGQWRLVDGELQALQAGKETNGRRLVPRAYIAQRYFSSNEFTAEVLMDVAALGQEYAQDADAQHYGELAFRIKDLQVSAFAIPDVGMRLSWRYFMPDGREVVGNSAQDTEALVEDEMPLPAHGPYQVRLQLRRNSSGVLVEAFLNNERFARKLLVGLEDRVGKVALGCRNLSCSFDDLKVRGHLMPRPVRRVAASPE
ncbi:serine/threonine protein kinase [Myxococcus sp. AM009]|uniref:serine/threonine-protein kinase n=1 Tax=unclassified Myxococcus TaxID=2648731 RepID=UPI0015955F62|nr:MULTISPECIES: serine/threonine-protein kinase [unclassified Myxococcus]NVI98935.1 serine/threonine protein kinase [Myxococcus sp. AM009]NVJ14785.1 serine/threonine protein kinase [Myxococcus sp. AM010]